MGTNETINAWRAELETELGEVQAQLAGAESETESAAASAASAAEANQAIKTALDLPHRQQMLATAIALRVRDHEEEARRASVRLAAARQTVKGLRVRLADLVLAMEQLAAIPPASPAEREAEPVEAIT